MRIKNHQKSQLRYHYIKAEKYNRLFIVEKSFIAEILNQALDKWKQKKVLDVGCGKAEYWHKESFFVGIDPSERIFNAKNAENRNYIRGIGENLPLINGNFDVCFLLATLNHLGYPREALKEIKRVLKVHGHLIIILGNSFSFRNRLAKIMMCHNPDLQHIYFFSTKDVFEMLEKLGFKIVALKSIGYLIIPSAIQNLLPFKILAFSSWVFNKVFSIILPYGSSYFLIEAIVRPLNFKRGISKQNS